MNNDDKLKKIKKSLLDIMRPQQRWLLLVGTGASVEMDADLGMPALRDYLLKHIPKETEGWKPIAKKLSEGIDLETSLTKIHPAQTLQDEIAKHTKRFVANKDAILRDEVLTGKKIWVGEPLLQLLMRGLSPTWPRLPIVTSNYDMLIEYACSKAGIPYTTGYHGELIRRQDWTKARERYYRLNTVTMTGKRRNTISAIPHVELMKVHGSINLFRDISEDSFVENDFWIEKYPPEFIPMIAPPGDAKTQDTLRYYDRLFREALQAIDEATAFIVIGYGFRDEHIHQGILERVRDHGYPLIVLTRSTSEELGKLPAKGKNVWVITGILNKTNGKTDSSGTCFVHSDRKLSGNFDNVTLWQSDVFTKQILGG